MEQPVKTSGDEAFASRKQYIVPSYQRNYVWRERAHWEPLWEDIRELTRQILADGEQAKPHFLGTIITKEIGTAGFINQWWVVDGQQRLTTLQVFIAATHTAFSERGLTQSAILSDLLVNPSSSVKAEGDEYKIKHKSSEYAGFTAIIDAAVSSASSSHDPKGSSLSDCYAYFLKAVREWLDSTDPDQIEALAGALTTGLLNKLQVVDIRLDDRENSHTIFETLNARGAPLTEWEKTKNYILSLAVREDDSYGDKFYREHLECYDADPYWSQTVSEARFHGKHIDRFLFFFAQIELPKRLHSVSGELVKTLPRGRLYRDFRYVGENIYRANDDELMAMAERLKRYADIYKAIDERRGFSVHARQVMDRTTGIIKLSSLVPVFMELVKKLGDGDALDRALSVVDSYLMRRVALKAYYSGFDDVAFAHVQALRDTPADEIVSVLIDRFDNSSSSGYWPSDDQIIRYFLSGDMYNRISKPRLRNLLSAIAEKMHGENTTSSDGPFTLGSVTIEHVVPQDWQRHWADDLSFDGSEDARHRLDQIVHRIGNLTLVAYNSKLSNRPWAEKRELLAEDRLEMNKRLLRDMKGEAWNETEIRGRSEQLANYVIKIGLTQMVSAAAWASPQLVPQRLERRYQSGSSWPVSTMLSSLGRSGRTLWVATTRTCTAPAMHWSPEA